MMKIVLLALAAFAIATSQAAAASAPYRTDAQAEHYLSTGLKSWAGIKLSTAQFRTAFCLNGYYSKTEKRTGHHSPTGQGQRRWRERLPELHVHALGGRPGASTSTW